MSLSLEETHPKEAIVVINMMAISLDGLIATRAGESDQDRKGLGVTCPEDREWLLSEIAQADAIILGSRTAKVPQGIIDIQKPNPPTWCLMSEAGLSGDEWFWKGTPDVPKRVYCPSPQDHLSRFPHVTSVLLPQDSQSRAAFVLADLQKRGCRRVLLFGGGQINRLFYESGLINHLYLTVAPVLLGTDQGLHLIQGHLPQAISLTQRSLRVVANHIFLEYDIFPLQK